MNEFISVIMSTYNEVEYIEKTITSILNQSYKDIEIVIVDDGSTDGTKEILQNYLKKDNFKILFESHSGNIGKNLNLCIKKAKGNIIAVMGADDMWVEDKLKIQIQYLMSEKIVCSNGVVIDKYDNIIYDRVNNFKNDFYLELPQLLLSNCILASSVLAYKTVLEEAGLFDETIGNRSEDYALWLRITSKTKIMYINQFLVKYRVDGNNLSIRTYYDRIEILLRNLDLVLPFTNNNDLKVRESAYRGVEKIYAQLTKYYYFDKNFENSFRYCKNLIHVYKNKFTLKYAKYLLFYLYILIYRFIKNIFRSG